MVAVAGCDLQWVGVSDNLFSLDTAERRMRR